VPPWLGLSFFAGGFALGGFGAAVVGRARSSTSWGAWGRVGWHTLAIACGIGLLFPQQGCIAVPFWFTAAMLMPVGLPLAVVGYALTNSVLRRRQWKATRDDR
jgi:hypothetical protein